MSKEKWIKSKAVIFLGLEDRFAGIFIADNQEQIDMIRELMYDYPYTCTVYDDISRLTECVTVTRDVEDGTIYTTMDYLEGKEIVRRSSRKSLKELNKPDSDEEFFKKIEEIFGTS